MVIYYWIKEIWIIIIINLKLIKVIIRIRLIINSLKLKKKIKMV